MNNNYERMCQEAVMHGPLESLFCCIGDPVVGNPTQLMMEASFRSMRFPARYLTCTVQSTHVQGAIEGIRALGFAGANVTAPHKVTVIPYLDGLTESARLSQAVNCILVDDGKLIGDNTDGKGFLRSIEEVRPVSGMRALVIGAGGAARAIVTELALHGAREIVIANRTIDKARHIIRQIGPHVSSSLLAEPFAEPYAIQADFDLVVQATSVGLFNPDEGLDLRWESSGEGKCLAADVVFNPVHTRFLACAREAGATAIDGLGMLVYQGAIAIQQWTGKEADGEIMRKALEDAFTI